MGQPYLIYQTASWKAQPESSEPPASIFSLSVVNDSYALPPTASVEGAVEQLKLEGASQPLLLCSDVESYRGGGACRRTQPQRLLVIARRPPFPSCSGEQPRVLGCSRAWSSLLRTRACPMPITTFARWLLPFRCPLSCQHALAACWEGWRRPLPPASHLLGETWRQTLPRSWRCSASTSWLSLQPSRGSVSPRSGNISPA